MTAIEAKIYKTWFVFFSDDFHYPEKSALLAKLKEKENFKNGNEVILPIPDSAPPEIPLMILSKENDYELKFSKKRIDYSHFFEGNELVKDKLLKSIEDIFNAIDQKIKNVGLIISLYFEGITKDNIHEKLVNFFKRETEEMLKINHSEEFTLRSLHKETLKVGSIEDKFNIAFEFNIGKHKLKGKTILIHFDMNTFSSSIGDTSMGFVTDFFRTVFIKQDDFVKKIITEVFG